ncbi:unnamed protein product [Mytilus coruscus]|uniref:Uncharacterized protein n=1 Tax=Mytilus coruscus TaxID=42192 RepID=A0A6J8APD1_MYTCO|nr:unnamed protein product [Mytilus coruscus]
MIRSDHFDTTSHQDARSGHDAPHDNTMSHTRCTLCTSDESDIHMSNKVDIADDLMSTSAKDSRINDLFTEGSNHRNLSVLVLNQNLYFGKDPTQRRNCHYLVLFNNPIDRQPVMTLGRQMYPSKSDFFLQKFGEATSRPYGFLLVDLKPGTAESSRLRTDVLQTCNGVDTSEEMKGDDSSDTESTGSDILDDREDLIACRDCGLVFAHYRGLENHNCRTKSIRLPMSGEALDGILSGTLATVCCADDLPAYVSDRPNTFVVNTDNCNQEGTHWIACVIFLYRDRLSFFLLPRRSTRDIPATF